MQEWTEIKAMIIKQECGLGNLASQTACRHRLEALNDFQPLAPDNVQLKRVDVSKVIFITEFPRYYFFILTKDLDLDESSLFTSVVNYFELEMREI